MDPITSGAPYLSVVVAARNDTHGGDPLGRLQALVNAFSAQCCRFGLDAELIVVEWNPPSDRPRLRDVVRLPAEGLLALRFVEVPPELHATLPASDLLPLFQMIAKNVGIRRARGAFVLSTNLDILLSNELVQHLAGRPLAKGRMYRADRHDVESPVPVDASLGEQMAWCAAHHLRVHAREATYAVDAACARRTADADVVDGASVGLGDGWHVLEGDRERGLYRWAATANARLSVDRTGDGFGSGAVLELELASNPYEPDSWIELDVLDRDAVLASRRIAWRQRGGTRFCVALPDGAEHHEIVLRLRAASDRGRYHQPLFERRDNLLYRLLSARVRRLPVAAALRHPYTRLGPFQPKADATALFAIRAARPADSDAAAVLDGPNGEPMAAEVDEVHDPAGRLLLISVRLRAGQLAWIVTSASSVALSGAAAPAELAPAADANTLARRLRVAARDALRAARRAERRWRAGAAPRLREWVQRFDPSPVPDPPADVDVMSGTPIELAAVRDFLRAHRPPFLHLNACGDFQLMAREHWFDLRGFAEVPSYSMSLDGLLSAAAEQAGIRETVFDAPMCIYHQEHAKGSGWTPEGEGELRRRIAERGITWVEHRMFHIWAASMAWLGRPMIFNGSDWGFGNATLPEAVLHAAGRRRS